MHHVWGEVEPALTERLAAAGVTQARIINFAVPAQTTRDSRLKYAALEDASFDLVILYHGINESRANNAPPDVFRADYSHYSWYDTVNTLAPYQGTARFALPYTIKYAGVLARTGQGRYVPVDEPRPEWVQYGRDVRTAASLEDNLTAILDLAQRRGDPVMLMTFAIHVPANYSRAAFDQHALDYRLHRLPLEVWGRPDNVVAAVAAHNAVVRRLASHRQGVLFVDQDALMEKSAHMFDDPCHLTIDGSVSFADHIMDVIRPRLPVAHSITQ
jgi:lysophospholipase L1-like esterase